MMRLFYLIFLFNLFQIAAVVAQPGDPGGNPTVPISGIEILVAGGAMLGIKQWQSRKSKKQ